MLLRRDNYIIYPIGLEDGKVARLELPEQFTKWDAQKISRIVIALQEALPTPAPQLRQGHHSTGERQ